MKNIEIVVILVFFCVSVKSDLQEMGRSIQHETQKVAHELQQEGKFIKQEAENSAAVIKNNIRLQQNDILETVELIENGVPPENIKSNTTSLTTNVHGKIITIKNTIFTTGNDVEGAIHNVETIYEESEQKDWSINTFAWNRNGRTNSHISNNGGSQIISNGGSIITIG
ncbi:uncharacterized protein LOC127290530 isoform X2 [Leptopilina boulardi]|uniref:uncharacterized protein LOC127290530 isoform X2 n=1 Tax=Leptopilina boulardi TaxID=63433 RepID=UPI0021F62D83|nr:uncharacterized protein LOC127290530 isoform X2 [Leptopilina boulardi]